MWNLKCMWVFNIGLGGKRHIGEPCCAKFGSRIKGIRIPRKLIRYSEFQVISHPFPFRFLNLNPRSFVCTLKFKNPWIRKWKGTASFPHCNYTRPFTFSILFLFLNSDGKDYKSGHFPCWRLPRKKKTWAVSFPLSPIWWHREGYFSKFPFLFLENAANTCNSWCGEYESCYISPQITSMTRQRL